MRLSDFFDYKIKKRCLLKCKVKSEEICLPNNITSIGAHAFSQTNAKKIILSNGVLTLERNSFSNNTFIHELEMSDSVSFLDNECFANDENLVKIRLSNKIYHLSDGVFYNCFSLSDVNIPISLNYIGEKSFYNCNKISEFQFNDNLMTIKDSAFAHSGLGIVDLSNTHLHEINSRVFYGCTNLRKLVSGKYIEYIGTRAFSGCNQLDDINLNKGLLNILSYAFSDIGAKRIILPSTVKSLGKGSFSNCSYLENIELSNNLMIIDEECFANDTLLNKIILPQSLTFLGKGCFKYCTSLEEIVIPSKIKIVFDSTFCQCDSLKKVEILNSNSIVEKGCFKHCDKLEKIIYKGVEIDVRNIEPSSIDTDALDFLILHQDKIKNIKCVVDFEIIKLLDKNDLLDDFCSRAYYKNYKNLCKMLFSNNKACFKDKKAFFLLCYKLGVFNKNVSQKSSGIIASFIDGKILKIDAIGKELSELNIEEFDDNSINEITYNNGVFLKELFLHGKSNPGFVLKCLENYKIVQSTHKSKYSNLKPTLEKFINFYNINKFANVNTQEDEKLAIEIGKFFDNQSTYDKAKLIIKKFNEEGICESLIEDKYRKEIINHKKQYSKNDEEFKQNMNVFYYEFLNKNDPINFTMGKYCGFCCAFIDGDGENLCFASVLDPYTQTLLIKNENNEIVSKATFSLNDKSKSMIINSIQTNNMLMSGKENEVANRYMEAIKVFINSYNKNNCNTIHRVYLSTDTSSLLNYFKGNKGFCESIDYNKYSLGKEYHGDWKEGQICIYDSKMFPEKNFLL